MELNTRAIIQLAWARRLGLPDDALIQGSDARALVPDASVISSILLFGQRILCGPRWFLDRSTELTDAELDDPGRLLAMSTGFVGRLLGSAVLSYCDAYVPGTTHTTLPVSPDRSAALDLERRCAPDEVNEAGLSEAGTTLVLLDELDVPLAGVGLTEWEGLVGQLSVLTSRPWRRQGYGRAAALLGTNEALDRGLIPQWRAREDNVASRALGDQLGFRVVGRQTTVRLS